MCRCACMCVCVCVCTYLCCAAIVLIASEQLMGLPSTATCDRLSRGEGHNIRGRSKRGRGRRGKGRRKGIIEQQVVCDWTYVRTYTRTYVRTYVHTLVHRLQVYSCSHTSTAGWWTEESPHLWSCWKMVHVVLLVRWAGRKTSSSLNPRQWWARCWSRHTSPPLGGSVSTRQLTYLSDW